MPLHLWFEAPPRQHPALGPHGHRARARRELKGTRPQVCVELSLTARLAPVVTVQARERIAKGGGLEIDRDTPRYPEITRGCGSPKAADLRCSTAWEGSAVAPTFATRPPTLPTTSSTAATHPTHTTTRPSSNLSLSLEYSKIPLLDRRLEGFVKVR